MFLARLPSKRLLRALGQLNFLKTESHTDIKVPNFDEYRKNTNPTCSRDMDNERGVHATLTALAVIAGLYSAKAHTQHYILSMSTSAEVLALASIEINLKDIPEGGHAMFKWRGRPLFIKHRTKDEIDKTRAVPLNILRDPEKDEDRCVKPEWLVVIGVCTHLGCVPIPNSGDFPGGYYCPCHGSHFDAAGRARKGPAPRNLEIPPHIFKEGEMLTVG